MNSYVDKNAIMNVIGCLFKNSSLLENEEYWFTEDDFYEKVPKIIFGALNNLYIDGIKKFDLIILDDYLSKNREVYPIFQTKGIEYIKHCVSISELDNFDYYFDRMKKFTYMRALDKNGISMKWFYDPSISILNGVAMEEQENRLNNISITDLIIATDKHIDNIRIKYNNSDEKVGTQAGSGLKELLEKLKETPEIGIPMYGKYINTITKGARLSKLYLRSGATGLGKALPNDTIIPTPDGYKKVGEIKAGDYLFDAFGKPTKVMKIFPQGEKEVWEITFKDGRTAKCSKDHLWSYCSEGQKLKSKENRIFMTDTLENIAKKSLYKKGHGYQILVPMQKAVEYEEKDFYLKPYSMGLLLGDGSFRYTKQQKALEYSSENEILPKAIAKEMNWEVSKTSDFNYTWIFKWKNEEKEHKNVWVEEALKDYSDLWNLKSNKKFIPKEYLRASIKQRRELLNGLLDSDGSVNVKGKISYFTNSSQLKDDVIELCYSLGLKATCQEDRHKNTSVVYMIHITGTPEDKVLLFRLPRKKKLIEKWYSNSKRKEHNLFNPIVKIKKLDYSTEMTCFLVDNEEHLFLMNDFIVTHNTRTMVADACTFACNELYDTDKKQWIKNGTKEPTLFIATEQELEEIQTLLVAFVADVDEEKIIESQATFEELSRIARATQIIEESPLYIVTCPDFSLEDIENIIKMNIKEYDIKYICYDYLHTSMKILEEITKRSGGVRLREDNVLFMISVALKDLCNKYQVFIITSTQLNGDWIEAKEVNQNLLRGAKSIADKVDLGEIIMPVRSFEVENIAAISKKMNCKVPTVGLHFYKNRRSKYKDIVVWCENCLGTCKLKPIFVTDKDFNVIDLTDTKIVVKEAI